MCCKKYKKYFFVLFFLLLSLIAIKGKSQSKRSNSLTPEPVTIISYASYGGDENQGYVKLTISKDSITYEEGAHNPRIKYRKVYRNITPTPLWDSLKRTIDIGEFDKIKSNESNAYRDGSDTRITIKKGGKTHSVLNANFNKAEIKTSLLVSIIENKLHEFARKATNN